MTVTTDYTAPSVDEFKAYFVRDFSYGTTSDKVMDGDITRALADALFNISSDLFDSRAVYANAYCYLAAHNLVMNIKNSTQGLSGSFGWLENSKSVGGVSQSFAIPDDILKNPSYAYLAKTGYGMKYLSLVLPLLHGNMGIAYGTTQA